MPKHQKSDLTPYQHTLRELSDRIVEAQKPIRILNAIKWTSEVKDQFFKDKFKKQPRIDQAYYEKIPLAFDPEDKIEEFYNIERDVRRLLGQFSGVSNIMLRMCREYREVIRLLKARGTAEFPKISQELYGSSDDAFYAGAPTLNDLALLVSETLSRMPLQTSDPLSDKIYSSEEAVKILSKWLAEYFNDKAQQVHVKLSDDIWADAAAGADVIRLRRHASFSERELRVYEVHEGWVHIGTTLNGMAQPVCTFLSKGPPSSTITQEGLAIIMEIFTFSSYPQRVLRLTDRVTAVHLAEEGANFIEIFNFYRERGLSEDSSFAASARVFRGCLPEDGAFTKDLAYSKGFIMIYNFIRLAIKDGLQSYVPLLFLGKTTLEDLHVFSDLLNEGILVPPKYLPPQFKDLAALTAWMSYSLFLNRLNLEKLTADYREILPIK